MHRKPDSHPSRAVAGFVHDVQDDDRKLLWFTALVGRTSGYALRAVVVCGAFLALRYFDLFNR